MDNELTAMDRKSSDDRMACSDDPSGSTTPPSSPDRARESDHQGAQNRCAPIGRIWPTTIVAPCTGGASQSKWTRKTQPWNMSLRTTVVAFISIEKPRPQGMECMPKPLLGAVGTYGVLRPHGRRRWQGYSWRSLRHCCPSWATASTAPPSTVRMGGGDRDDYSVVIESR